MHGGGRECCFRCVTLAHEQTDYLLSYPDEKSFNAEQEAGYLEEKMNSPDEIELAAIIDGKIVGIAGMGLSGESTRSGIGLILASVF